MRSCNEHSFVTVANLLRAHKCTHNIRGCRPSAVPLLISIIGRDAAGQFLLGQWQMQHLPTDGILQKAQASTPMVSVIFTQGSAAC